MSIEPVLNRLKSTLRSARGIEAMVLWARGGQWTDATGEMLEHEEIVYYAEGLLLDGFSMAWQVLGEGDMPDHLRLFFWQSERPAFTAAPAGLSILELVEPATP